MLIIVCGLPGSGKTTLAKALSKRLGAGHLSSDVLRRELFPNPTYSEDEKKAVYSGMALRAGKLLSEGRSVVADATFYKRWQREMFLRLPGEKKVVLCTLGEDQLRKRLARRKAGRSVSDADFEVYMKLKGQFEPIEGRYIEIDTATPLKARVEKVLRG